MNQQQGNVNNNTNTGAGGLYVQPRQEMEYLCAGERSFKGFAIIQVLTLPKIVVPRMRLNLANPFVVENVDTA